MISIPMCRNFADIFKTANINSVTAVVMEVPCCSGLPMIVKKGMAASGREVPINVITVGCEGGYPGVQVGQC